MSLPVLPYQRRRPVLVEVTPSLGERVRLWLYKLKHPRHPRFGWIGVLVMKLRRKNSELRT